VSAASRLGTHDWRAYALFRSAAAAKNAAAEKELYRRALRLDPKFRPAQVNLARVFQGEAEAARSKNDPATAEARWCLACELLEAVCREARGDRGRYEDASYYTALYHLAAIYHERGRYDEARRHAEELIEAIRQARRRRWYAKLANRLPFLRSSHTAREKRDLWRYLDSIEPGSEVVLGTLEALGGDSAEGRGTERIDRVARESSDSVPAMTHYNLAVAYAQIGAASPSPAESERLALAALSRLERALAIRPAWTPNALRDPILGWLENQPATGDRFKKIVGKKPIAPAPPGAPTELAEIEIVGEEHAAALAAAGIEDHQDLLLRAATPGERAALAQTLRLPAELLDRWTFLADLLRVVGLRPPHVNLLERAGIDSVRKLAAQQPAKLAALLSSIAQALGAEAPDGATLTSWVQQAGRLQAMVS
jgi:tetratricopeptide (TPR) repeat protein